MDRVDFSVAQGVEELHCYWHSMHDSNHTFHIIKFLNFNLRLGYHQSAELRLYISFKSETMGKGNVFAQMDWKHIVENLFSVWQSSLLRIGWNLQKHWSWLWLCVSLYTKHKNWSAGCWHFFANWIYTFSLNFLVKSTFLAKLPSYPTANSGQPPPCLLKHPAWQSAHQNPQKGSSIPHCYLCSWYWTDLLRE